jgi:hypothetical protein
MMENERSTAINPGEAVEEKVSLSDRFGLWLGFHRCSQDEYPARWLHAYADHDPLPAPPTLEAEALEWGRHARLQVRPHRLAVHPGSRRAAWPDAELPRNGAEAASKHLRGSAASQPWIAFAALAMTGRDAGKHLRRLLRAQRSNPTAAGRSGTPRLGQRVKRHQLFEQLRQLRRSGTDVRAVRGRALGVLDGSR